MILESPGAVAFKLGPLVIHWYGIMIAAAFIIGLAVIIYTAKKEGEDPDKFLDLATYIAIIGVLSARLYYVIFNWQSYQHNTGDILKIWNGGLSIHGGIIGGFIVLIIYTRIHKVSLLKYGDILAYGTILAQSIGRWGNFFNSEAFGAPTNGLIKLYIPPESRPPAFSQYEYFHPTFLYESMWDLFVFLILYFVLRKKFKNYNGAILFSYLILYSLGRFVIESIRIDSIFSVSGLPIAQIISIIFILIGICGLYFVTVRRNRLDS